MATDPAVLPYILKSTGRSEEDVPNSPETSRATTTFEEWTPRVVGEYECEVENGFVDSKEPSY